MKKIIFITIININQGMTMKPLLASMTKDALLSDLGYLHNKIATIQWLLLFVLYYLCKKINDN